MAEQAPSPSGFRPRRALVATTSLVVVLVVLAGVAVLFIRERNANARQVERLEQRAEKGPVVRVAQVKLGPAERVVTLPAEVRAEQRATLYAKVSGYVKTMMVDKGGKVRRNQELAVLESPDLDEQVSAAEAELRLRKQQLTRALSLSKTGFVSQQDREQLEESVKVAETSLARAKVQKGYQIIRAPFDGTVTARFADPGTLLPAATGGTSGAQPLLEIAQLDRLRIALQLGQDDASRVRVGDPVTLQIDPTEPPLRAPVSRLSQALDPRTRTMLCEIDLVAPPPGLYPGAFVQASITLRGSPRPLVPTDALVAQGGQLFVATVADDKVHFTKVRLGVDDGQNIEVLEGLRGGELVALNLATDVADGSPVRPQPETAKPK
ncbi:MAG TPA: efflux RND transporter periplasmic adaptor subunit [Myxococcales bacterium]|nr:efflux RND transporter periplasmic adaptor subunit [Myxococcales bacterium]